MSENSEESANPNESDDQPVAPQPTSAEEAQAPIVVADGRDDESSSALPYPVVAIGASAGGVEAYIELFNGLDPETGMAFIVVPHLQAAQKSHMVDILGRHTTMAISEIAEGLRPERNCVYVLPPGVVAGISDGVFHLERRPADHRPVRTIDIFFRSLAADQKTRAIGVILSGSDGDGALGLQAIKGEGGISIVQTPDSARFSEMPRSSISLDHVDRILPPDQIATELAQIGRLFAHPELLHLEEGAPEATDEPVFLRILNMLRSVSGVDFRLYKPSTVRRRIARRMLLHRIPTLAGYAGVLQGDVTELSELQQDCLINVTQFFRDPEVYQALKEVVFPRIFQQREPDRQIRIWVAGCSSGEEPYSIAMCLLEYLTGQAFEPPIQIFGTDASDGNIQRARTGIYPESITADVSPERLRRFFIKVDKGYQVSKRVRELCIFARQNLCTDPPFSRMDLISCRNVLIYFGPELQKRVLPTFHYALRPDGFLLLGTSETVREYTDYFQLIDRKHKIFARIANGFSRLTMAPRLILPDLPPLPVRRAANARFLNETRAALTRQSGTFFEAPELAVPSRVLPLLALPEGSEGMQLARLLRDGESSPVSEAVRYAMEQDRPVRLEGLRLPWGSGAREIALEVVPIEAHPGSKCFLVLLAPEEAAQSTETAEGTETGGGSDKKPTVDRLRNDLASIKLYLQTLLDERDSRNQELVSANEEIQSANEEMQSTNEELETTKEELQSSNEELQTVNDELQQRNMALTATTNDLSNLLNSVNLPVIMLSNELHIRHFTPPAQRVMNLRAPDIGRPFSDIRLNLETGDLEPVFHEVLESLAPREMEVRDREGHWYLLRIRPYRTTDNKIEGVVVVLVDIDQLRSSQKELEASRDFAQSVMEGVPLPLMVVDLDCRIHTVNDAFRALAGIGREEVQQRSLIDMVSRLWGFEDALRKHMEALRDAPEPGRSFEFEHETRGDRRKVFNVRCRVVKPDGEMFMLITLEDITAHKQVEYLLGMERERLTSEVATTAQELGRTRDELRGLAASLFTSQEEERRRVARELHDDICQKLAVLEIDAQQIEPKIAGNAGDASRDLEQIRAAIGALSEDVRRISHTLHPSVIDDLGVVPAIRSLVDDFREREHMIATFAAQDVPDGVPVPVATGLYRITQEALRNVSKHAGKTHVKVLLKGMPGGIRLQVVDSGEGFDVQARRTGLGLVSMEERARLMEATFTVESRVGEGTKITVEVALPTGA